MYIFDKIFVTGCFGSCHFPTDDTVIDENFIYVTSFPFNVGKEHLLSKNEDLVW